MAGVLIAVFGVGLIVFAIRNMTKPVEETSEEEIAADEDMQQEIDEIEEESGKEQVEKQLQDKEESGE